MKRTVLCMLALLMGIPMSALAHGAAPSTGTTRSPNLLYIASGRLWLRSVEGGPPRVVATPWRVMKRDGSVSSEVQWSPDGRRVAVDGADGRLAVIALAGGRVTLVQTQRCSKDCSPVTFAWSPNGRYLAFVQPLGGGETGMLRVWDSDVGRTRSLLGRVATYVAYPEWSHDSSRIGIEVGKLDVVKNVFPRAVAVDLAGHVVRLGEGMYLSWSPDDRLVGIIRPHFCGANTCDEDVLVRTAVGTDPVVLARHSSSLFDNPVWARQPQGYAFDRWLLGPRGHVERRLAGPRERVLSWRADGSRLALQTYYPYQGTPDVLYLSTPAHARVRFYSDGWNAGCGACSKDVYSVIWGHGDVFAFSTPTYPTPKNVTVHSKVFVSSTAGGPYSQVGIPGADVVEILGFTAHDRGLVIHAGRAIYRYNVASHQLATVVTGVPADYSSAMLDPRVDAPTFSPALN